MPLARTSRTARDLETLLAVARGRAPADLYLDGATLLNVYSGELYPANVAVKGAAPRTSGAAARWSARRRRYSA